MHHRQGLSTCQSNAFAHVHHSLAAMIMMSRLCLTATFWIGGFTLPSIPESIVTLCFIVVHGGQCQILNALFHEHGVEALILLSFFKSCVNPCISFEYLVDVRAATGPVIRFVSLQPCFQLLSHHYLERPRHRSVNFSRIWDFHLRPFLKSRADSLIDSTNRVEAAVMPIMGSYLAIQLDWGALSLLLLLEVEVVLIARYRCRRN